MLERIFDPNNIVFRACGKIFDMVVLSALFCALCLPVVTIGPAVTALYYTVVKCVRRGESATYKNFFRAFKENFKVGAVSGVLVLLACALLWAGWFLLRYADPGDTASLVMRTAYMVALVVPLGTAFYMGPVLSRFTLGVGGLFSTSLKLAVKHLPSTAVLVLLNLEAVQLSLVYLVPLYISPALTALLSSLFLERIFKKYTPAPEAAPAEPEAPAHPNMDDLPVEELEGPETPWYLK